MKSEPGLVEVELVAQPLLWLDVRLDPTGLMPGEVQVDLRALMIADAKKKVDVGAASLDKDPLALQHLFTVLPQD
jgi:hypothetical protein